MDSNLFKNLMSFSFFLTYTIHFFTDILHILLPDVHLPYLFRRFFCAAIDVLPCWRTVNRYINIYCWMFFMNLLSARHLHWNLDTCVNISYLNLIIVMKKWMLFSPYVHEVQFANTWISNLILRKHLLTIEILK